MMDHHVSTNMAPREYTTISVEPELRDEIRSRKRGQESYSDVLERLIDENQ